METSSVYSICVKGQLDSRWAEWFEGLKIASTTEGETSITGPVRDQAELHGLLNKVRDLGLPLISVMTIENELTRERIH